MRCLPTLAILTILVFFYPTNPAIASQFIVTTPNFDGVGSIHAAIASANTHAGPDTILFNIAGPGPHVIHMDYSDGDGLGLTGDDTLLDGYSQAGASPNTEKVGRPSNAVIKIVLNGGGGCDEDFWGYWHALGLAGERNVVRGITFTGGFCSGIMVGGEDAVIEGCSFSQMTNGIYALSAVRTRIGGESPASRNVIGGNWRGILVGASVQIPGEDVIIQGNYIGTTGTFAPHPNNQGIVVYNYSDGTVIGGREQSWCARPQAANCISFNTADGISIMGSSRTSVLSNVIHSNGGLAIDIGDNGPTANDALDADAGPNDYQNAPTVTSIQGNTVFGFLQSAPERSYTIQAFDNGECDPSGRGEGKLYIGTTQIVTDESGFAEFSISCPSLPSARFVTATATDEDGNTSEFWNCSSTIVTDVPSPTLAFELGPNVPNPFNPTTTIRFNVASGGAHVEIMVFDVAGALVRTLLDERHEAGPGSVEWDGRDNAGREMASGMYFYRMRASNFEATRKMVLLK